MSNNTTEYSRNMQKLVSTLQAIMESFTDKVKRKVNVTLTTSGM